MATQLPHIIPVPPAAVSRLLARFDRNQLAGFISVAIDLLDIADDDHEDVPDFRSRSDGAPGDPADAEPDDDAKGDTAWSEHHTRGRHKLVDRGSFHHEPVMRADGHGIAQEDDEEDDADMGVEDDPRGFDAEEDFGGEERGELTSPETINQGRGAIRPIDDEGDSWIVPVTLNPLGAENDR